MAFEQMAANAGMASRKREAERRMTKYETKSIDDFAYSSTYLRKSALESVSTASSMVQDAIASETKVPPFAGGLIAVGAQYVRTQMSDSRRHYTHQADSTCEESSTFGGPRSVAGGWSARIQRRFFLTVKQFDTSPIEQSVDPLAFIVLKFPDGVRTNKELVTTALKSLFDAIRYKLGGKAKYPLVWNIEFTWPQIAHINLLMAFPETSYRWLLKAWMKRARHAAGTPDLDVLHVTRPSEVDEDGCLRDFDNQFASCVAYMAGLGDLLGFVKGHQYKVPDDWAPVGEGAGRMWGVQGMGRARVSTYPINNLAQKEAIESYLRQFCPEKLVEYTDPLTNVKTTFNDGPFSETRRAGSLQCLMVSDKMHEHILDLLERHASPESQPEPAVLSADDLAALIEMTDDELPAGATEPLIQFPNYYQRSTPDHLKVWL